MLLCKPAHFDSIRIVFAQKAGKIGLLFLNPLVKAVTTLTFTELKAMSTKLVSPRIQIPDTDLTYLC